MLFTVLTLISILAFQTIQTTMSPATLKAMATIQAHKARAVANALRARALYNTALARSNLGLLDHRIVRDTSSQVEDYNDENNDDNENNDYDDYLDMNMAEREDDARSASHPELNGGKELEHIVGLNEELSGMKHVGNYPNIDCACNNLHEYSTSSDDAFRIPLKVEEIQQLGHFEGNKDQDSKKRRSGTSLRSSGQPKLDTDADPTLGLQPGFQQAFATTQPQFGQQVFVPWQFMSQSIPTMQMVPQGAAFSNIPIQSMSPLQPGYGPQMIFLRQAASQSSNKNKHANTQEQSALETDGSNTVGDPHIGTFSHTHTHTHSHSRFQDPIQNIQVPNTQIVTPGVNLHINQNQNSVVPSRQIIQPGFSTTGGNFVKVVPSSSVYSQIPASTFAMGGGGGHQTIGHDVTRPSMSASQSQMIQTNMPSSFNTPTMGGNTFSQSQAIYQGGRVGEPIVGMRAERIESLDQFDSQNSELSPEKVGTFLTDFRMSAPESPADFDPERPRNLQPVVNYIERQSGNMDRLVQSIENNEKSHHNLGPLDSQRKFKFVKSSHQNEDQEMIQDYRLGTFPMESIQINPLPTLPENFAQLNPDQQREAIDNYLEEEQKNAKNILDHINENNIHNMERLSNLMNLGPDFTLNPEHLHKPLDEEHDLQSDIIGSTQFNNEPLMESQAKVQEMTTNKFPDTDFNLGHIIDVPQNQDSDWYSRSARSPNKTSTDKLDKLLLAEKEVVKELKKDAKHDEDLMAIDYIGENMINDLEKKKNETKRVRREIGRSYNLPLNRFIHDPRTRLDIPKTLDNLGAVAKNAFEHEKAPLYHVRNMMGSAQDAVLATMKIPTKNFLIPSQYDIVNKNQDAVLGDINPLIFSDKYSQPEGSLGNIAGTFHKVGSAIRGGVLSGQEALSHVGQAANHAKNAIHSTRYIAPRLRLQQIPAIAREPRKKAVLITPRILDVTNQNEHVGNALDDSPDDFVGVGHILDALGVSNPNNNEVKFEKIIMEPQNTISIFRAPDQSKPSKMFHNLLGNVRVEDFTGEENEDEQLVGDTLNNLEKARESFKVESLKEFFAKIKQNVQGLMSAVQTGSIIPQHEHSEQDSKPISDNQVQNSENVGQVHNQDNLQDQNQEIVEASMFPEGLMHPFMGHFSESELDKIWNEANTENPSDPNQTDKKLGQILGAINPMMLEKLFNESVRAENNPDTPFSMFHHDHDGHSHGPHNHEDDEVGTSMKLTQMMMKPFMGQANSKITSDFFHKYTPDAEADEENEYKATETPEWLQVVNDGNNLEYSE